MTVSHYFVRDLNMRAETVWQIESVCHVDALKVRLGWLIDIALDGTHEYEVTGFTNATGPPTWRDPLPGEGASGTLRTFRFRVTERTLRIGDKVNIDIVEGGS